MFYHAIVLVFVSHPNEYARVAHRLLLIARFDYLSRLLCASKRYTNTTCRPMRLEDWKGDGSIMTTAVRNLWHFVPLILCRLR